MGGAQSSEDEARDLSDHSRSDGRDGSPTPPWGEVHLRPVDRSQPASGRAGASAAGAGSGAGATSKPSESVIGLCTGRRLDCSDMLSGRGWLWEEEVSIRPPTPPIPSPHTPATPRYDVTISSELRSAFDEAQLTPTRVVRMELNYDSGFVALVEGPGWSVSSERADFDAWRQEAIQEKHRPLSIAAFCSNLVVDTSDPVQARRWTLLAYIPHITNPFSLHERHMIDVACESIVESLGADLFRPTFRAATPDELSWSEWQRRARLGAMSEIEKLLFLESMEARAEMAPGPSKKQAVKGMSFVVHWDCYAAAQEFKTNQHGLVELVVNRRTEKIELGKVTKVRSMEKLLRRVNPKEPRFYLLRCAEHRHAPVLALWAPEGMPAVLGAIYSIAWPTLRRRLNPLKLGWAGVAHVTNLDDFRELIRESAALEVKAEEVVAEPTVMDTELLKRRHQFDELLKKHFTDISKDISGAGRPQKMQAQPRGLVTDFLDSGDYDYEDDEESDDGRGVDADAPISPFASPVATTAKHMEWSPDTLRGASDPQ